MAKRKKQQQKHVQPPVGTESSDPKPLRLAHKILTKTIWPANLQLEDAIETLALVAKALVLSHTADDEPVDRSNLIAAIEEHFSEILADIDPLADRAHLWLVSPQGLITEPFGILWDGGYEESSVKCVLGAELDLLRTEHVAAQAATGAIIIEGVDGVAATIPDWDGEDTSTCEECDEVHNVHLAVAEGLFQQTVERRQQRLVAN